MSSLVHVEFDWSDEYGECYECGRPAAYSLPSAYGPRAIFGPEHLRCAVCAAQAASEGETIVWLFADADTYALTDFLAERVRP